MLSFVVYVRVVELLRVEVEGDNAIDFKPVAAVEVRGKVEDGRHARLPIHDVRLPCVVLLGPTQGGVGGRWRVGRRDTFRGLAGGDYVYASSCFNSNQAAGGGSVYVPSCSNSNVRETVAVDIAGLADGRPKVAVVQPVDDEAIGAVERRQVDSTRPVGGQRERGGIRV